jgi:uncharacterized BrkB/YihY/UPF0761 family membrane protein
MSWQNSANQARSDAQRGLQNAQNAANRHHGPGRKPRSPIGRFFYAILNLIGFLIALAILAVVAVVGYLILTSR